MKLLGGRSTKYNVAQVSFFSMYVFSFVSGFAHVVIENYPMVT